MSPKPIPDSGNGTDAAAHDVLAAEEFALPAADPTINPHRVVLPEDPTGIPVAHDVLAAEEFAMPAVRPRSGVPEPRRERLGPPWLVAALLLLFVARRRRRRARRARRRAAEGA